MENPYVLQDFTARQKELLAIVNKIAEEERFWSATTASQRAKEYRVFAKALDALQDALED